MKIYNFKQHTIAPGQEQYIKDIVKDWAIMKHNDRTGSINSINVHTRQEWVDIRVGKFTASTASQFLADPVSKADKDAGKLSESAKGLCYHVMAEQMGWRAEQNPYMEHASIRRGLVFENTARQLASQELGETITECGFVESDVMFGCSPDGLIMKNDKIDALIEIKVPEPKSFYKQLMDCANKEYQAQMQFAMSICDCPRAYFVLYCPEINPDKVFLLKYTRGMAWQEKIKKRKRQVVDYIHTVQEQVKSGGFNIPTLGE